MLSLGESGRGLEPEPVAGFNAGSVCLTSPFGLCPVVLHSTHRAWAGDQRTALRTLSQTALASWGFSFQGRMEGEMAQGDRLSLMGWDRGRNLGMKDTLQPA